MIPFGVLIIASVPANVYAARQGLAIQRRTATPLPLRAAFQVAFVAAVLAAGC